MRTMLFGELLEAVGIEIPEELLQERLTYDQLFRMSEPKRFHRSLSVKMPPLDMQQYQTGNHWCFEYYFNAKGNPSTTGLRHRGYVRFKKPKKTHAGKNTPLSQLPVEVDCMCPDYRYRWAWANHQRDAGPIGKNSLNQCINRAPRKTNPKGVPGLCKHILATRDYIYGLLSGFPPWVGDTDRLDKLTKRATRRWLNFDQEMDKARERDARIAAAKARRNIGLPPEQQNRPIAAIPAEEPPDLPPDTGDETKPETPKPAKPARKSTATKPSKPTVKPEKKTPSITQPQGLPTDQFLNRRFMKVESVDSNETTNSMKTLNLHEQKVITNARKLVEEMEDDFEKSPLGDESEGGLGDGLNGDGLDDIGDMPPPSGADLPSEPPVSDTAVGANTADNIALTTLREIRDLLAQLVADEGGEGDEMLDLPPDDGSEEGPHDDEEGETSEEGEEFTPGKRPMPVSTGAE
jgi:hypothetical protein